MWSVHNTSSLLLLPHHTFPLLQCGVPPKGYSPSETVSAWVPHEMQPIRNRLLHCGPQFLPENILLHGLLSTGWRSCQEPPPAWTPNRLQLPSGHLHRCGVGSSTDWSVHICFTMVVHGQQRTPCFSVVSPQATGESLLQHLEPLLPLFH